MITLTAHPLTAADTLPASLADLWWWVGSLLVYAAAAASIASAAAVLGRRRRPSGDLSAAQAAARRHEAWTARAAWGFTVAVLITVATVDALARTPPQAVLAPVGLLFLAVHVAGELTWPRPSGTVRRAPLARRTVADVTPRVLHSAVRLWASLAVASWVAVAVLALGRATTEVWALIALNVVDAGLLLGAAEAALRLVVGRPTVSDAAPEWDLLLRRRSALRVLRGAQLWMALQAAGALDVLAGAWGGDGGPQPLVVVLWALVPIAALVLLTTPRLPRTPDLAGSAAGAPADVRD